MENVASIAKQLRQIPSAGMGFDLLRYRPGSELADLPRCGSPVQLLGLPTGHDNSTGPLFRLSRRPSRLYSQAARSQTACLGRGWLQTTRWLHVRFVYSENLHRRETIESLAAKFRDGWKQSPKQTAAMTCAATPSLIGQASYATPLRISATALEPAEIVGLDPELEGHLMASGTNGTQASDGYCWRRRWRGSSEHSNDPYCRANPVQDGSPVFSVMCARALTGSPLRFSNSAQ